MAGAHGELDGHFTSPVDIHALVAELHEETDEISQPAPLLLKPAGEDDWQPLVVASTRAA
jgi:hypothetical protein